MKKEVIYTGKSVEEALENALNELGLDKDSVEYEVIEYEKKGILGFGSNPAKIKISYNEKKDGGSAATEYIKSILDVMNLEAETSFEKTSSGRYKLSVSGESAGLLIGHHGDTLDALQYLLSLAVNKREEDGEKGEYMNITLDIENYRERREEALRSLARRMANKALKYKRSIVLEPMLPYERRIIHSEVQGIQGVSTNSIGVENNRKVVIFLEENGFNEHAEKENRNDRRNNKNRSDRDNRNNRGERREGSGRSPRKSTSEIILQRMAKKPVETTCEEKEDYISSTAYLREPAKRFSSFAEYESHMAELALNSEKSSEENN